MTSDAGETTGQLALRAANEAMVAYSTHPVARAVMSVIPLGTFFDSLIGTAGSNLVLDRLNVLVDELRQAIERMPAEKQDPTVTEERLIDPALRAVRGATETGDQEKVRAIAAALVGAISVDRPADLDVETALAALSNLTPADLRAARRLADHLGPATFPPPAELGPDSLFFVARLQAAGLLESVVLPASPPGSRLGPGYRSDPAVEFRFTPTFGRILALLRAGGVDITG
jgi:hypothetical protein